VDRLRKPIGQPVGAVHGLLLVEGEVGAPAAAIAAVGAEAVRGLLESAGDLDPLEEGGVGDRGAVVGAPLEAGRHHA
jgi:hypothetical protein